jgi:YjbE family integral membrane protein
MIEHLFAPLFWIGLGQIILINILLSGDNAVVIALAARTLQPTQQKQAIIWGSVAAIIFRVILTIVAVEILKMPYLRIIGGLLLLRIAVQLMVPENENHQGVKSSSSTLFAIRTIVVADLIMSLDNVISVAAVARGNDLLVILGLAISIPLIIVGSTLLLKLMDRFPVIITVGAALLGWVAGEMLITDPSIIKWVDTYLSWTHVHLPGLGSFNWMQVLGAGLVVVVGKLQAARAARARMIDLAADEEKNKPK